MHSKSPKEIFLNTRVQQVEVSMDGKIIASDNTFFFFQEKENLAIYHPFLEAVVSLLPTLSERIAFPCVNLLDEDINKILDIEVIKENQKVYLLLFDFTKHYQDAHPLVQEKNEASISKNKLAFEKKLLQAKEVFKNKFLANINHEIRNPLNNMLGFMELLRKTKLTYDQNELLKVMERTGIHIKQLMDDMLDISKIERGRLSILHVPFNLGHIITNLERHYLLKIGTKKVYLNTSIEQKVPKKLIGDPVRLNQILFNLLENAFRNTDSGTIYLSVALDQKQDRHCSLSITVSDTGKGIPTKEIDKVFDSYYQIKESKIAPLGDGLGLKIVKDLVNLLKGKVNVRSNAEETVFTCTLPFEIRTTRSKKMTIPKGSGIVLSKRVLLVENIETNQMLMMRIFLNNEKGFILEIAKDASQAMQFLSKRDYQLIITKSMLPDASAEDFIEKLKQNDALSAIPVLIASGSTMVEEQKKILEAGASGFLSKPFTQKQLFESIEKLFS